MKRYKFLTKDSLFASLNKLRSAFLAAKDGSEVDELIKGILTSDERIKIGRRIQIANLLKAGFTYQQIMKELKVGNNTILIVERSLNNHPFAFDLINRRDEKVEKEYKRQAFQITGGAKMVYKRKVYTGFKRKEVQR